MLIILPSSTWILINGLYISDINFNFISTCTHWSFHPTRSFVALHAVCWRPIKNLIRIVLRIIKLKWTAAIILLLSFFIYFSTLCYFLSWLVMAYLRSIYDMEWRWASEPLLHRGMYNQSWFSFLMIQSELGLVVYDTIRVGFSCLWFNQGWFSLLMIQSELVLVAYDSIKVGFSCLQSELVLVAYDTIRVGFSCLWYNQSWF